MTVVLVASWEKIAQVPLSPSLDFLLVVVPSRNHSRNTPKAFWLAPLTPPSYPSPSTTTPFPAGGEWRLKYERAVREVDFTKKRLQQELEDKMEVEQQSRRQLERRVRLAREVGPV